MPGRCFLPLVFLSCCFLAAACSEGLTEPGDFQGLFDLVSVGDAELPVLGAPSGGCPLLIDHGSVALDSSGRYSAVIDAGITQCANGDRHLAYTPDAGTYAIFGDSIEFEPDGAPAAYWGRFVDADRHFLELHHTRGTYTYFRFR